MTTIIQGTPRTEVYVNESCGVCIKQFNYPEEDMFVYFSIEESERIIQAIREATEEAKQIRESEGEEDEQRT